MVNYSFDPAVITVTVGTTVVWTNKDNVSHTVTSDTGLFDSGLLANAGTFSFTFAQAGTYPYYCRPHGGPGGTGMSGKIIVTP
jgi:plastocyanin